MPAPTFDRAWFHKTFAHLATGWYRMLRESSPSCAVWETPDGVKNQNFKSASGKQCDGVTRWMPALAAWAAQPANPATLELEDGAKLNAKQVLRDAFVHAFDPGHADFWGYGFPDTGNQRQVESSIVAWSLWLSRGWLLPMLDARQRANIQQWLASCTDYTDHYSNWSLFTATNHAARIALAEYGFSGDAEAIRRDLIVGDEVHIADGWLWDGKYHGIDYYNFWVWGSHHCYLRAMLPDYESPMLDRALDRFEQRQRDLPFLIDATGRNVLFGRSLPYRWGWLSGLAAAHYLGRATVGGGLTRAMLARNLQAWLDGGSLNEHGTLRERLSPNGSDGGRSAYINCGHPYWGMQAFLCLALPDAHPFWSEPAAALPIEKGFLEPRQGPGMVLQGIKDRGEVRLYNLRNTGGALYGKWVYSTAFPCASSTTKQLSVLDTQLALRLADGTLVGPREILEVDVNDGRTVHVTAEYRAPDNSGAVVHTTLRIDADGYTAEHFIRPRRQPPEGAQWVEGGFTLGVPPGAEPVIERNHLAGLAEDPARSLAVCSRARKGWTSMSLFEGTKDEAGLVSSEELPHIIDGGCRHFLFAAPVSNAPVQLAARHLAGAKNGALRKAFEEAKRQRDAI